jgi:hypothetical protein
MPRSALNQVPNADVLRLEQIAVFLLQLSAEELPSDPEEVHLFIGEWPAARGLHFSSRHACTRSALQHRIKLKNSAMIFHCG